MPRENNKKGISRREFVRDLAGGLVVSCLGSLARPLGAQSGVQNDLFWVKSVPDDPYYGAGQGNYHIGVDVLLNLMGNRGLKFYRSSAQSNLSGPEGLIGPDDVVLIKVNAQWKYRGCTNSDLIRGLIQRILDHPDTFMGEVVLFENGQGRGSLNCDSWASYGNKEIHANANDESQTFLYLVNHTFHSPRVSAYLLDPIRGTFIGSDDHQSDGYRTYENVSYPCFTTANGHRVELAKGIWSGNSYSQNLKVINVPVLKHHDVGGAEITASLKHFFGVVSMSDGQSGFRHYGGLGETGGKMVANVATPVLHIVDAIWVSLSQLKGYPAKTTARTNQILASQDPVALDYWASKYVLYPVDKNPRHHPGFSGIDAWLTQARDTINGLGGLRNPSKGVVVGKVTKNEAEMRVSSSVPAILSVAGEINDENSQGPAVAGVMLRGFPENTVSDSRGIFSSRVVSGWSGEIWPKKEGATFVPEKRIYSALAANSAAQNFVALKIIYPPLDLTIRQLAVLPHPRGGVQVVLAWRPNEKNADRNIAKYRIYQVLGGQKAALAEVDAVVFRYIHRDPKNDVPSAYVVAAVNNLGREGAPAATTIVPSAVGAELKNILQKRDIKNRTI